MKKENKLTGCFLSWLIWVLFAGLAYAGFEEKATSVFENIAVISFILGIACFGKLIAGGSSGSSGSSGDSGGCGGGCGG